MYKYNINHFLYNKNNKDNKVQHEDTVKFRQYIMDSTNESIQKKIDFNNKYPYNSLVIEAVKDELPYNALYKCVRFVSIYVLLYYFYSKKH